MNEQKIKMLFDYIGIEDENRYELINDEEFMLELSYVDAYAVKRGLEYCLDGDIFRFVKSNEENRIFLRTANFVVFSR